jgi:hypothetical protein
VNRHPMWAFIGLGLIVLAVFGQSFQGRRDLVESQRAGCHRGKLDRAQNARGWRTAEKARLVTARNPKVVIGERRAAYAAAVTYDRIAADLEQRTGSNLNCSRAFPSPSPLPFFD